MVLGKLACPARLNAAAAGQLLYIVDEQSGRRFLVDSGASLSLLPHLSSAPGDSNRLLGPTGKPIASWGGEAVQLSFGGRAFPWQFLRAAVAFPILGLDFLKHHQLCLDAAGGKLIQLQSGAVIPLCRRGSGPSASVVFTSPVLPLSSFSAGKAVPGEQLRVPSSSFPG
jgi:hypothetical protein